MTLQKIGGELAREYPEGMGFESQDLERYIQGLGRPYQVRTYSDFKDDTVESVALNYYHQTKKSWDKIRDEMESVFRREIPSKDVSSLSPMGSVSDINGSGSHLFSIQYQNLPKPEPIEDSTKIPIVQRVIQKGLEVVQVNATEQELHNYKGIPPFKVVHAMANAWRSGKFDKMVVVDVEEKKIALPQATRPLIVDPLFACKINEYPDRYYLLAGWLEDISLGEFLKDLALGGRSMSDVIQILPDIKKLR